MALIPPGFLDCVVAIGFGGDDGKVSYQATGLLYGHPAGSSPKGDPLYRVYLVTNRHVFENEATAHLRFNPATGGPARTYPLDLKNPKGQPLWTAHPEEQVDIAVQSINVKLLEQEQIQFAFFIEEDHVLRRAKAIDMGLAEGDHIYVLGFPMGQVGEERNYVIVRGGIIARIRDTLAGAARDFLVDASIFPGNSGGPVVTEPQITAIEGTKSINAAYLIGVVAGYVPYQDIAVSQQSRRPRIIFEENSGLAAVVPIDRVPETIGAAEQRRGAAAASPPAPAPAAPSS